jgi:phage gp16-like protein
MSERSVMVAKIHVAKKQLALSEESYRDILRRVTRLDSTSSMSVSQLDRVLSEFRRLGFRPTRRAATGVSKQQQIRMIHGVWGDLVELGAVEPTEAREHLRAFCARQAGISDPAFLDSIAANKVLEGLKAWRARARSKGRRGDVNSAGGYR